MRTTRVGTRVLVYLAADDEPAVILGVVLGDLLEGVDLRHLYPRRGCSRATRSKSMGAQRLPARQIPTSGERRRPGIGQIEMCRG